MNRRDFIGTAAAGAAAAVLPLSIPTKAKPEPSTFLYHDPMGPFDLVKKKVRSLKAWPTPEDGIIVEFESGVVYQVQDKPDWPGTVEVKWLSSATSVWDSPAPCRGEMLVVFELAHRLYMAKGTKYDDHAGMLEYHRRAWGHHLIGAWVQGDHHIPIENFWSYK